MKINEVTRTKQTGDVLYKKKVDGWATEQVELQRSKERKAAAAKAPAVKAEKPDFSSVNYFAGQAAWSPSRKRIPVGERVQKRLRLAEGGVVSMSCHHGMD